MRSWTAGVVRVIQQGSCSRSMRSVRKENGCGSASPGWISSRAKSIPRAASRHGVPVLNRSTRNPAAASARLTPEVVPSPARPPAVRASPVCITAWRNVPVVSTTAPARYSASPRTATPTTRNRGPPCNGAATGSSSRSSTVSWRRSSPGVSSTMRFTSCW